MFRKVLLVAAVAVAGVVLTQCSGTGSSGNCNSTKCPNGCCDSMGLAVRRS